MLNLKNVGLIGKTFLNIQLIENAGMKLKLMNSTKRTYHFKLGEAKISIAKKSLWEFYKKYE